MIVNESSSIKKIKDATAISKEIGYNEIAYVNNNEKIIGDMPINYKETLQILPISIPNPNNEQWETIAYGNGKYVIIGEENTVLIISDNGTINTIPFFGTQSRGGHIEFGNGIFVFLQDNTDTYYSYDGINWTYGTNLPSSVFGDNENALFNSYLIYDKINKLFIASCSAESEGGIIWGESYTNSYSYDGINWDTTPATYSIGGEATIYKNIFVTENGDIYFIEWNGTICDANGNSISRLEGVFYTGYYSNGIAILHNDYGLITYYSTDNFQTWTPIELLNGKYIKDINYFNNNFVLLAENNEVYISSDCINWKKIDDEVGAYLTCVNNEQIIALSNNKLYCSYDGINWYEGSNQDIYKLEKENEGMWVTIPEQTVERRIIKEEYNNTPYIRFEDETLIFSSLEEVEENTLSNHPEGSYYVVYEDQITFGFYILAIDDYDYFTVPYGTTWEQFAESQQSNFDFSIASETQEVKLRDVDYPNFVMPNTTTSRAISSHLYTVIDENNNICYKDDIITTQKYGLMY